MPETPESDPTARTLRLLAVLQTRPSWPGDVLARRLEVSPRTLRRDLRRLKDLGYGIEGKPGPGGHYALGPGAVVPPLLFEEDEVVALVAGLRMVEDRSEGDAAERTLAKLTQALPRRLAGLVAGVSGATTVVRRDPPDVGLDVLAALTLAASEDRGAAFSYRDRHDRRSRRRVDSLRCLYSRGQWYAVAFDLDRDDWRVFLVPRIGDVEAGERRPVRAGPTDDLVGWLESDFGRARPR